ncbi:MAG: hypothetical protein FWD75_03105 [Propionibacteriaceae bacterium]|nr:hypothetical protein [Propionibacteriaceae bacterium]
MRRFIWFALGVMVGSVAVWHGKAWFTAGKPEPVAGALGRFAGAWSSKLGAFIREYVRAWRAAQADQRF